MCKAGGDSAGLSTAPHARPQPSMLECWPARKPDAPATFGGRLAAHVLHEEWHTWAPSRKVDFLKTEVLLGITICFAQVPESVAFAFMAHIKPPVALHAAWVVGLICTLLGGRSGMVNGAEGAYAAIIGTFIAVPDTPGQNGAGVQTLFPSVMCAGAFMLIIWAVGGDRCARAKPHPHPTLGCTAPACLPPPPFASLASCDAHGRLYHGWLLLRPRHRHRSLAAPSISSGAWGGLALAGWRRPDDVVYGADYDLLDAHDGVCAQDSVEGGQASALVASRDPRRYSHRGARTSRHCHSHPPHATHPHAPFV